MLKIKNYTQLKQIYAYADKIVYSAIRETDQTPVIIKTSQTARPTNKFIVSLTHEYEITKTLDSKYIIKNYELLYIDSQPALIQEDIHGISLKDYLSEHPGLEISTFLKLAIPMIQALLKLHQENIIHKDIKPGNFIINPKTLDIKLTDFNFAAQVSHTVQELTSTDTLEGTLAYMAPEQTGRMNLDIDYRCDFYSLGLTFYYMLVNRLPIESNDPLELVYGHIAKKAPLMSAFKENIPTPIVQIIDQLLQKTPITRYQSALGILADLEHCQSEFKRHQTIPEFKIGAQDISPRLNISQKLYGREAEIKILLDTYAKTTQGQVETLFVKGHSGIGKSMVVHEVLKTMSARHGYFIQGKFDQLDKNTPYTALTQALNQLSQFILAEPKDTFNQIKETLLSALGDVAQLIIDIAPDFEFVLGKQPSLLELPPQESYNRLLIFFKKFIAAIASAEHPILLFIDDLQWTDSSSLELLNALILDPELSHFLLIGAYRDNEVDTQHQLNTILSTLQEQSNFQLIDIQPLTLESTTYILNDTFKLDIQKNSEFLKLSQLIHQRAQGNPFFIKQLLNTFYEKKFVDFNFEQKQWKCEIEQITQEKISDNVIDFMLNKINTLPKDSKSLLQQASCIGNQFDLEKLHDLTEHSTTDIQTPLTIAIDAGLIVTIQKAFSSTTIFQSNTAQETFSKNIHYRFNHDRIQQAFHSSFDLDQQQATHLKLARHLKTQIAKTDLKIFQSDQIFILANHFNQAIKKISKAEQSFVIYLNHHAGLKAKLANVYQAMHTYLQMAYTLNEKTQGKHLMNDPDIGFSLQLEYALSLALIKKLDTANRQFKHLLTQYKQDIPQAKIYFTQSQIYLSNHQLEKAIDYTIQGFSKLGFFYPKNPSLFNIAMLILQVMWQLRKFPWFKAWSNENLKRAYPYKKRTAQLDLFIDMLGKLAAPLTSKSMEHGIYANIRMLLLNLKYGRDEGIGLIIGSFANFEMSYTHRLESANYKIKVGIELSKKNKLGIFLNTGQQTMMWESVLLNNALFDIKKRKLLLLTQELGDNYYIQIVTWLCYMNYTISETTTLQKKINQLEKNKTLYPPTSFFYKTSLLTLLYLSQLTNDTLQNNSQISALIQEISIKDFKQNLVFKAFILRYTIFYYFFCEKFSDATDYAKLKYSLLKYYWMFSIGSSESMILYSFLMFDNLKTNRSKFDKIKHFFIFNKLNQIKNHLKFIVQHSEPFKFFYFLFLGKSAAYDNHYLKAICFFEKASVLAIENGYDLWAAVANEQITILYIEKYLYRFAKESAQAAYYHYSKFGLLFKANKIKTRYPFAFERQFLTLDSKSSEPSQNLTHDALSMNVSTSISSSGGLDFLSIIKSSQSISRENNLTKLLENILNIVIENTGADRAIIIEKNTRALEQDPFIIRAETQITEQNTLFKEHRSLLSEFDTLPHNLLQVVIRDQKPITLSHAALDSKFKRDPYIKKHQIKSILCLPMLIENQLQGMIYLENNTNTNMFTQDRVTVLNTLAAQISISLKNAHQLEHLNTLNQKTTRFVPKRYLEVLQKQNIEQVELGDYKKLAVTAMFTDIRDFTHLSEKLGPNNIAFLVNTYLGYMAPIIRTYQGFVGHFLGDGILAIFPHSPIDALASALEMQSTLITFNQSIKKLGFKPWNMGIGLNYGDAIFIILGEKERLDANILSDAINTTARIEGLNKMFNTQLLFSHQVYQKLEQKHKYLIYLVNKVQVKGKAIAQKIYTLSYKPPSYKQFSQERQYIALFKHAFRQYERGNFKIATTLFSECLTLNSTQNHLAEILLERCEQLNKQPPPKDWDGTLKLLEK